MLNSPTSDSPDSAGRPVTPAQRIVIVECQELVSAGLARLFSDIRGVSVVGRAATAGEALDLVGGLQPDVVVVDDALPDTHVTEFLARIAERAPAARSLVLSCRASTQDAVRTMHAGAQSFLLKSDHVSEVEAALQAASGGATYISSRMREEVAALMRLPVPKRKGIDSLSRREYQLLHFLVRGATLQEAAKAMGVSESSVSTYRRRLIDKLGVANNAELVRFAVEHGFNAEEKSA